MQFFADGTPLAPAVAVASGQASPDRRRWAWARGRSLPRTAAIELRREHVKHVYSDGQPGEHKHHAHLIAESFELRRQRNLHGDDCAVSGNGHGAILRRWHSAGSVVTVASGQAVTNTAALGAGARQITATYSGDTNYSASTSSTYTQTVMAPAYAKPGGLTSGACESWANACELRYALTQSVSGQEIWAAAGTYKPTGRHGSHGDLSLKTGVAVYGGFPTTGDPGFADRDSAANVTVLSGDLNGNDAGFTNNGENSYHVGTGATGATLDGVTISGGNANGSFPNDRGGGMYNSSSSPTLTNVTFSGSTSRAGGGMYNNASSPVLTNVTFSGNSAAINGGGMYNNASSPTLTNVTFSGNQANRGGGMHNADSSPTLTNVTFSGNSAATNGGGMSNYASTVQVQNSILWGNTGSGEQQIYNATGTSTIINDSVVQGGCPTGSTCTNVIPADPMLGSLGDYGGSTQTIPLLPGSAAINAGNATYCTIGHDQRGVSYVGTCDLGAFESRGFALTKSDGDNQHTVINTAFPNPLSLTLTEAGGPALPGAVITFTSPGSGPSAVPSSGTATTNGSGMASVTATANAAAGGPYNVGASAAGGAPNVDFALTNDQATALVTLSNLTQQYDGTPKSATVTTNPIGLSVTSTYTGISGTVYGPSTTAPTNPGAYNVETTVTDPNYQGSATDTLVIQGTATAPVLLTFTRQTPGASPTNADTLVFRASFSKAVQNVDSADFTVNGTSTATVTGVAAVNAGTYDVTVSGGDLAGFNGTVGLDLAAGQNITDLVGNGLPAGEPAIDQAYLLDNTSPAVTSVLPQNPLSSPTNLALVTFRITFGDDVQNVNTTDFSLATTGTATGAIGSVVVQSARVYDVVITGVGGNGVLDLNMAAVPPGDIADVVGNLLGSNPVIGTEETYTIDTAAPSLLSFTRRIPATSPTNADTLVFRATFSEAVQNVDSADFTVERHVHRDGHGGGCRQCLDLRRDGLRRRPGRLQRDGRLGSGCRTEHHGPGRQFAAGRRTGH